MTETPEPHQSDAAAGLSAGAVVDTSAQPVEQQSDEVVGVLAQVRERGYITTGEIFAAFPDLEPDTDELRALWDMYESQGIKVLDEIQEELQREDQRRSGASSAPASSAAAPRRRVAEAREHRPSGIRATSGAP